MKNNLKIIIFIIIVLVLVAFIYTATNKKVPTNALTPQNTSPVATVQDYKNFTDSNGSFSFNYNPFFSVSHGETTPSTDWELNAQQNGLLLASVNVPRTYMPKTNFSEAKLTIGKSSDKTAVKYCTVDTSSGQNIKGEATTISGYPFTKFTFNDAGAGNFYETTSYRGILGGNCYAIEYTMHSTNIGNYSPDQGIKEFNKAKIINDLESIIKSLKIIVASN